MSYIDMFSSLFRRGLLPLALALCACGIRPGYVHSALDSGRDPTPELTKRLGAEPGAPLPRVESETGKLLLERGTLALRHGSYAAARADLALADLLIDREDMRRMAKLKALQTPSAFDVCWQSGWAEALNMPYGPRVFERLLLNPLGVLARAEEGDVKGAAVEARRFHVMADFTRTFAPSRATRVRAFGEGLAAMALAKVSDTEGTCSAAKRASATFPSFEALCAASEKPTAGALVVVGYGRVPRTEAEGTRGKHMLVEPQNGGAAPRSLAVHLDDIKIAEAATATLDIAQEVREDFREATKEPHIRVRILGTEANVPCDGSSTSWESLPAAMHATYVQTTPGDHVIKVEVGSVPYTRTVSFSNGPPVVAVFFVE